MPTATRSRSLCPNPVTMGVSEPVLFRVVILLYCWNVSTRDCWRYTLSSASDSYLKALLFIYDHKTVVEFSVGYHSHLQLHQFPISYNTMENQSLRHRFMNTKLRIMQPHAEASEVFSMWPPYPFDQVLPLYLRMPSLMLLLRKKAA